MVRKLLVAAIIVVLGFPAAGFSSGIDVKWDIYGSARLQAFNYNLSDERQNWLAYWDSADPYKDTQWTLDKYTSRIGFFATSNDFTGCVELRPNPDDIVRLWYGKWDFGQGELLVGKSWTPLNMFYSNEAAEDDNGLLDNGSLYELRQPMVQLKMGGFKVALVEPGTAELYDRGTFDYATNVKTTWPKIELGYSHEFGPIVIDLYGGYNSFDIELTDEDITVDSYVYGAGVTGRFGPVRISVAAYKAKNGGAMGISEALNYTKPEILADNSLVDADSLGLQAVLAYKVHEKVTLEAGWGQISSEIDDGTGADDWYQEQTVNTIYLQARISLTKNMYIIPEIGRIDYGGALLSSEADGDAGEKTFFGAQWRLDF